MLVAGREDLAELVSQEVRHGFVLAPQVHFLHVLAALLRQARLVQQAEQGLVICPGRCLVG